MRTTDLRVYLTVTVWNFLSASASAKALMHHVADSNTGQWSLHYQGWVARSRTEDHSQLHHKVSPDTKLLMQLMVTSSVTRSCKAWLSYENFCIWESKISVVDPNFHLLPKHQQIDNCVRRHHDNICWLAFLTSLHTLFIQGQLVQTYWYCHCCKLSSVVYISLEVGLSIILGIIGIEKHKGIIFRPVS